MVPERVRPIGVEPGFPFGGLPAAMFLMALALLPGCHTGWLSEGGTPASLALAPHDSSSTSQPDPIRQTSPAPIGEPDPIASGPDFRSLTRAQSPDEEYSATHLLALENQLDYSPIAEQHSFDHPGGMLVDEVAGQLDKPAISVREDELPWQAVLGDYQSFYSPGGMGDLVIGLGVGGLMAHTNIDSFINDDLYQETIRSANSDEFLELFHEPKIFGEGKYMLPAYATLALARDWIEPLPGGAQLGEWGERSWRTVLTGGPAVLVLQRVLGGSRPGESESGSHWKPFEDNNAVSGHAFMGAVPFLSAAAMTDRPGIKLLCYAGSVLPALSRINDEGHYPSQAFLGWYLAFLASRAVDRVPHLTSRWKLLPWIGPDRTGVQWEWRF